MKTGSRKLFFVGKNRWLLLFLALGAAIQAADTWLPSLVLCYRANEKPRVEFMFDVCACRKNCAAHALAGQHECGAGWRNGCLDVPLVTDPRCGALPGVPVFQCGPCAHGRGSVAAPCPVFLPGVKAAGIRPPPRSAGPGRDGDPGVNAGGNDPLFRLFRC